MRTYILYDSRSIHLECPSYEHLLEFCASRVEALDACKERWGQVICYSYIEIDNALDDEAFEFITDINGDILGDK